MMQNEDTAKPPGPGDREWQTRIDLAALYRLAAFHGWDEMISGHISARLPGYRD